MPLLSKRLYDKTRIFSVDFPSFLVLPTSISSSFLFFQYYNNDNKNLNVSLSLSSECNELRKKEKKFQEENKK